MSRFTSFEIGCLMFVATLCTCVLAGIGYAIWGPHYPPQPLNAKREFTDSCEYARGIPDVHTNNWSCKKL